MEAAQRTNKERAMLLAAVLGLALATALAVPQQAHAILPLTAVVALGAVQAVTAILAGGLIWLMDAILFPLADVAFSWATDYISIPMVGKAILLFQVIALFAVVAIRIAIGVKDNILLSGGSREGSLGEYLFKSLASVMIVALMPMLCRMIFQFGNLVFKDVVGTTDSVTQDLHEYFRPSGSIGQFGISNDSVEWGSMATDGCLQLVVVVISGLALTILILAVGFQFLRRQIDMVVISLIAPLVSIYSATDSDSNLTRSLLVKTIGLVLTMSIQYILVRVAIGFAESFMDKMLGSAAPVVGVIQVVGSFPECCGSLMLALAALGCALSVPGIVNEYTTPTGNGSAGHFGMAIVQRKVITDAASMAAGAGKGLAAVAATGVSAGVGAVAAGGSKLAGAAQAAQADAARVKDAVGKTKDITGMGKKSGGGQETAKPASKDAGMDTGPGSMPGTGRQQAQSASRKSKAAAEEIINGASGSAGSASAPYSAGTASARENPAAGSPGSVDAAQSIMAEAKERAKGKNPNGDGR